MKIRNGFVSNSSSSSFLVALPDDPKNVEDIRRMFFPDQKLYDVYENEYLNECYTTTYGILCERLLASIEDYKSINYTTEELIAEFDRECIQDFLKMHKKYRIYFFNYSDDSGDSVEALLSDDELFYNVYHVYQRNS